MSETVKVKIPVVVTKSGAIRTGSYGIDGGGVNESSDHYFCYECLEDVDYDTGCRLIHVEAEIDIASLFRDAVLTGEVCHETN